jgi:hypothetical protein
MTQLTYAGIGSRETPGNVLTLMTLAAKELCEYGWLLRTGGAHGADSAFASGTAKREIHIPWDGYNGLTESRFNNVRCPEITPRIESIAAEHHPNWGRLSQGVRKLMCRNVTIVLGSQAEDPADMVVCWTPNGGMVGGTAHGMRVAYAFDIPVFNLFHQADIDRMVQLVHRKANAQAVG